MTKKILYTAEEMEQAIGRMAESICRDCAGGEFAMVGLYMRGVPLAERLCDAIEKLQGKRPALAKLDISLYRDDFGQRSALPLIRETIIPFDVNAMRLVLVDDVLSTGRTIRAALDALTDYGRPGVIRLAVLIDRGDPEFPIRADYVGMKCDLPGDYKVMVEFDENSRPVRVSRVEWQNPQNNG